MSARVWFSGCIALCACVAELLIADLLLFSSTPVYAQETVDTVSQNQSFKTCKEEVKSWENIDSELKAAGYGGNFDHSTTEYNVYKENYDKANGAGCFGVGTSGQILNQDNYNYLLHGQTSIEGSIGHTIFCSLAGRSPLGQCLGYTWSQKLFNIGVNNSFAKPLVYNQVPSGGAFGGLAMVTTSLYDSPPTSSVYYLAKLGNQFGVVPETAYAQVTGSGDSIIRPIEKLWEIIRNTTYLFFVLIFMAVGLMVMFRRKLDARTVVTVQQALPSLVVGLILVYFSYFIAAVCVDTAFFGVQIVAQLFLMAQNAGAQNAIPNIQDAATSSNVFMLFAGAGVGGIGTIFQSVQSQFNASLGTAGSVLAPAGAGAIAGALLGFGLPGFLLGAAAGATALITVPVILVMIVLTALLIQVVRLTFALIMAYIQILVLTIGGPVLIMIGSIPGQGGRVSLWLRGLLANSLIFPAIFAAVLFAGMVLGDKGNFITAPPLLGGVGVNSSLLRVLIAYGIIMGTPAIPDMIRGFLKFKMDAVLTNEAIGIFRTSQGLVVNGLGGGVARAGVKSLYTATANSSNDWFARNLNERIRNKYSDAKWFTGSKTTGENPNRPSPKPLNAPPSPYDL